MDQKQIESAGLRPEHIQRFLAVMRRAGVNLHSVLMQRGDHLFFEQYWQPFDENRVHRMYSVTKSFVAVGIGCLADEGKLSLDDAVIDYFPDKLPPQISPLLRRQTIRDMLTMRTCFLGKTWFTPEVKDRTAFYFAQTPDKVPGTLFHYDSTGSYVLGVLVERLSGMPLLDYLKAKVLNRIGGFETAQMLKTPDGTPWGDSALLCTPRALMNFARFVMNHGAWEGEQLVSAAYMQAAVSRQTDNCLDGSSHYNAHGYGYQIWRTEQDSYSFNGMGGQFAICVPHRDFIFVCTADSQLTSAVDSPALFRAVFDELVAPMEEAEIPLPPLEEHPALSVARGESESPFAGQVGNATYICRKNPMGITCFRLTFDENGQGAFHYENAQGTHCLRFGMKQNCFGKFPQKGYSDGVGNVHILNDFRYDCAASAGWVEARKLQLRVQILDRYFGILIMTFGFTADGMVSVCMMKCAEDFLQEYDGWLVGECGEASRA